MIFNISGVGQSTKDATALIDEIVAGKTAFIADGKVTGTGTRVQSFTTIPSTNQGNLILVNNNIYIWDTTNSQYVLRYSNEKTLSYIEVSPIEYFYTYGEQIRAIVTAYYDNGLSFDVSSSATFTPSIATNTTISVSYTDNNITKTSSFNISIIPSESNYSGESRISNEGHGKWTMECFTSGTFTCPLDYNVDIHLVGGGGSGAVGTWTDYYNQEFGGGGGGGGYTHSYGPIQLYSGTSYPIIVGSGGTAPSTAATNGVNGGNSSAFSYSVNGGGGGGYGNSTDNKTYGRGGNGGSAGGAGSIYGKSGVSTGGEHGMSTENARINDNTINHGGIGQDRDTYDWFDLDEKTTTILRAGGGGASGGNGNSTTGEHGSLGGHGGGGHGASSQYNYNATSGINHKGGGGGGGLYRSSSTVFQAGNGGSGIVLIRSHRNNKVDYYYTGNSQFIQDSETAWTLIMLDASGVFSVNKEMSFDLYLLGGGQCGYYGGGTSYGGYSGDFYPGAAGGQGGFITIVSNIILPVGDYNVIIGNGGTGGNGGVGGTTSFGNLYTAPGGGSGATGYLGGAAGGTAGEMNGSNTPTSGGAGADSTVVDFIGIYRGGGGGSGYSARYNSKTGAWSYNWAPASGGDEGGGRSMVNSSGGGRSATANYGGGGSGGCNGNGGNGGSGVVIIRTHR